MSALAGDNVVEPSDNTPWYDGPTLLEYLETVEVDLERLEAAPFRMPVQLVARPSSDFRGFAGTIAGGSVRPGDEIRVLPRDTRSTVERIVTYDGDLDEAVAGQAVTLTLADEIDASRGDMIAAADDPPGVADQFEATVVWMADDPMYRGRNYLMRIGSQLATATIAPLKYKLNVNTLEHMAATKLELNEIGVIDLELDRPVAFDPYDDNRETGGFILIDRITNETVGAGMIRFALRRAANLQWQTRRRRQGRARRRSRASSRASCGSPACPARASRRSPTWSRPSCTAAAATPTCSTATTSATGSTRTSASPQADRVENIRRVAEVARLMTDAGLIVLVSFISPFRERAPDGARAVRRGRVPRGLRRHAAGDRRGGATRRASTRRRGAGELANFTGIDSPYEPPEHAELRLDTTALSAERVCGSGGRGARVALDAAGLVVDVQVVVLRVTAE